ncbi:MAG: helicase C-terminal domain-containing protein [Candidatus Nitrosopolaris sp.]
MSNLIPVKHLFETHLTVSDLQRSIRFYRDVIVAWYIWQTALKLVQGYGRSIRSKEDWAKTYVLDSAFGLFLEKNKNILPDWFTQAIQGRIKIIS